MILKHYPEKSALFVMSIMISLTLHLILTQTMSQPYQLHYLDHKFIPVCIVIQGYIIIGSSFQYPILLSEVYRRRWAPYHLSDTLSQSTHGSDRCWGHPTNEWAWLKMFMEYPIRIESHAITVDKEIDLLKSYCPGFLHYGFWVKIR